MARLDPEIAKQVRDIVTRGGGKLTQQTQSVTEGEAPEVEEIADDADDDFDDDDDSPAPATRTTRTVVPDEDDDDEEEDGEAEEEDESEAQPEEPDQPDVKPEARKPLDKKERAIVKQKRIAQLEEQLAETRAKLLQYESKEAQSKLVDQFVSKGYDEDTAAEMAASKLENDRINRELQNIRLEIKNRDVLERYGVQDRASDVIGFAQAAGLTVEDYCRRVYGRPEPESVVRARKSARGEVEEDDTGLPPASGVRPVKGLTETDREVIENLRERGVKVDEKQYLARKEARLGRKG